MRDQMAAPVLLIEDTPSLQMVYQAILKNAKYEVVLASTAAEGLSQFETYNPDVILLDLLLPDRDGLDLMKDILAGNPYVRVIVITANGSINRAVDAMRRGAFDFLVKPFDETRLLNAIENALHLSVAHKPVKITKQKAAEGYLGFIGSSAPMLDIYSKISSISRSMATVFISGESGTGKEVCAQAVHRASNRATAPFVPLNCGAIPFELLESEVFGHMRGSFTGAIADKMGAAGAADGGTLFLDEICELDMSLQTKFLRFLQTSTIQPVGATTARKVNVRIICATNRDPFEEVKKGRFREDLYYRLHVVPIHLPPLRDRGGDVLEIAEKFLWRYSKDEGRNFTRLDDDVKALFMRLNWPGNVRQALNVLRNIVVLNDGEQVTMDMMPLEILHMDGVSPGTDPRFEVVTPLKTVQSGMTGHTLAEIERQAIEDCVARHDGSVTQASRELDVSPSTIYRKLERWQKKLTG